MKTIDEIRAHYAAARARCARNVPALKAIDRAEARELASLPSAAPLQLSLQSTQGHLFARPSCFASSPSSCSSTGSSKPCSTCGAPVPAGILQCAGCIREDGQRFRASHPHLYMVRS